MLMKAFYVLMNEIIMFLEITQESIRDKKYEMAESSTALDY
jgi:hypothetical protein